MVCSPAFIGIYDILNDPSGFVSTVLSPSSGKDIVILPWTPVSSSSLSVPLIVVECWRNTLSIGFIVIWVVFGWGASITVKLVVLVVKG